MQKHKQNGPVAPKGFQLVRIDGWDSNTPMANRTYVQIKAGYGEGIRATRARGGLPNYAKIINQIKKQMRTGRRSPIVLPPMSRLMRDMLVRAAAQAKAQQKE